MKVKSGTSQHIADIGGSQNQSRSDNGRVQAWDRNEEPTRIA